MQTPKYYSCYSLLLGQNDEGVGDIENMETDENEKPPVDNTAGMFKPLHYWLNYFMYLISRPVWFYQNTGENFWVKKLLTDHLN